ncbi:MAG: cupredoxin domain-containing protein [Acidimicrobiales bacterium]
MAGGLLLAACGSSDDPVVDTPAAGGNTPAAGGNTATTEVGGTQGQPSCAPAGPALTVTAEDIAWNTDCLAASADQSFTITMENKDSLPHNVAILAGHSSTEILFRGDITQGPKSVTYEVPALKAGTYVFHCEVHPAEMRGTFVVQ